MKKLGLLLAVAVLAVLAAAFCTPTRPPSPTPTPTPDLFAPLRAEADKYFARGMEHFNRGEWAAALDAFERAQVLDPDSRPEIPRLVERTQQNLALLRLTPTPTRAPAPTPTPPPPRPTPPVRPTPTATPTRAPTATPTPLPAAPEAPILHPPTIEGSRVLLRWDASPRAAWYNLYWSFAAEGPFSLLNLEGPIAATQYAAPIPRDTRRYYLITAYNAGGASRPSDIVEAIHGTPP